jgi:4-diphosphocytidyl-2C-methyl-D-erythritol kinase
MRLPRSVEVLAGAKVNVGWRVGERRPDGFHEVSGLIQTIALRDRIQITTSDAGPPLSVDVPGRPELGGDRRTRRAARVASYRATFRARRPR